MPKNPPTVNEVVERYKRNIQVWTLAARNDFRIMSESDDLNDIRLEYYPGWTSEHFADVLREMKKYGG
jgi:hypothetical protein